MSVKVGIILFSVLILLWINKLDSDLLWNYFSLRNCKMQIYIILTICSYANIIVLWFFCCWVIYQIWLLHWRLKWCNQLRLPADIFLHPSNSEAQLLQMNLEVFRHQYWSPLHENNTLTQQRLWLAGDYGKYFMLMLGWTQRKKFNFFFIFVFSGVRIRSQSICRAATPETRFTRMLVTSWLLSIPSIKWRFTLLRSVENHHIHFIYCF